jgi:hypothetical protein
MTIMAILGWLMMSSVEYHNPTQQQRIQQYQRIIMFEDGSESSYLYNEMAINIG